MKSFTISTFLLVGALLRFVVGADTISCDKSNKCPEKYPCCSQYGSCGTGSYCLGGCDPRASFNLTACMPQPRMSSFEDSFKNLDNVVKQDTYLGNSSEAEWVYTGHLINYDDAAVLQMPNGSTGTVLSSTKYLWFGKIGATMKSSRDKGVITAFITFSDVQDEIDFEFLGFNLTDPQTNYYALGILNYTNFAGHYATDTFENWHYYEIDWQEDKIQWSIDGNLIRTTHRDDTWNETTNRYDFPATPSRVQFSLWPGGDSSNALGTIEWAGGEISWDTQDIKEYGYYYAFVKNVTVESYGLPSFIDTKGNSSDYNAYLYNSTNGDETNVYLVKEKTYLGNFGATGIDPQNEDEEEEVETTVSSGSSVYTSTKTKTNSSKTGTSTGTSTATTATFTGGFNQNTKNSASSTDSGAMGISPSGFFGYVAEMLAMVGGFFMLV